MKLTKGPEISGAPNAAVPLTGVVSFATDDPATVEIDIDDGSETRTVSPGGAPATAHSCPLLGLRPGTAHGVTVRAKSASGEILEAPERLTLETPALPDDFPPINVLSCTPAKREPGYILFGASFGAMMQVPEKHAFLIAIDQQGAASSAAQVARRPLSEEVRGMVQSSEFPEAWELNRYFETNCSRTTAGWVTNNSSPCLRTSNEPPGSIPM